MSEYEIKRWDAMSTNNKKFPVIYVKPDETLLGASRVNSSVLMCTINNTESIYDQKSIAGVIIPSGSFPNQRPNFFKATGLYAIQLVSDWHGYPPQNGMVSFAGINETPVPDDKSNNPDSIPEPNPEPNPEPKPTPEEKETDTTNSKSLSTPQIILIVSIIILALIMLLAFTKRN